MARTGKWLLGSCCLHLLVIGSAALLCASVRTPPAVIDLSQLGHSWHEPAASGSGGLQQKEEAPQPKQGPATPQIQKPHKPKPVARMRPSAKSVRPAPQPAMAADAGGDNVTAAVTAAGAPKAGGSGTGSLGAGGAGGGSGTGGRGRGYGGRYFGFITALVQKAAVYPRQARRMGWQGTVTVSFFIRTDGSIHDAAVLSGSGHGVLDASALKAVRGLGRLPRPPEAVELRLPVAFRLRAAPEGGG